MTLNFKDISFKNILSSDFWFSVDRITLHTVDWAVLGLGLLLVAVAILLRLAALYSRHPVTKRLIKRFSNIVFWTGVCEAVWFGLRYENARVIGTHTVAVIILLIGIAYAVPLVRYWFRRYKPEREAWNKEQLKLKYLNK